jgi:hypothetical protein
VNTIHLWRTGRFAVLLALLSGCASSAASTSAGKSGGIPNAVFLSTSSAEWAEIRIRDGAALYALDNYSLYWGEGTVDSVPSGRHTLSVGFRLGSELSYASTIECTLLPGKSYVIGTKNHGGKWEGQSYIASAVIELEECGAAATAVPARNESLIEINLAGSYTRVDVDGKTYRLSSNTMDAAEKLRFIVPPGKHTIGSLAVPGILTVDVAPNRFLSYTVDTAAATLTQTADNPLNLIGTWKMYINGDDSLVYVLTFGTEGYGWVEVYVSGTRKTELAGAFTYTFTEKNLTVKDGGSNKAMEYKALPDGNILYLYNFWGAGINVMGIRQ